MEISKKQLVSASAISCILGLLLIYFASLNTKPTELEISDLSFDYVGKVATVSGNIVYKKEHPAGHIFLTLSDGKNKLQVPVFSGVVNNMDGTDLTKGMLTYKTFVTVTGTVDEYNGELQIVPRKASDIVVNGRQR